MMIVFVVRENISCSNGTVILIKSFDKNRGRKELTKRRRYDKLNTPSRQERQHQNRQQKRKQKEPIKKEKKMLTNRKRDGNIDKQSGEVENHRGQREKRMNLEN